MTPKRFLMLFLLVSFAFAITGCKSDDEKAIKELRDEVKELKAELDESKDTIAELKEQVEKTDLDKILEAINDKRKEVAQAAKDIYEDKIKTTIQALREELGDEIEDFEKFSDELTVKIREKLEDAEFVTREVIKDIVNSTLAQELKGRFTKFKDQLVDYFSQIEEERLADKRRRYARDLAAGTSKTLQIAQSLTEEQTDKLNDLLYDHFMLLPAADAETKERLKRLENRLNEFISTDKVKEIIALVACLQ